MNSDKIRCPFCKKELLRDVTICKGCGAERRDDEFSQEGKILIYAVVALSLLVGVIGQSVFLMVCAFFVFFILLAVFGHQYMFVPKTKWRPSKKKLRSFF